MDSDILVQKIEKELDDVNSLQEQLKQQYGYEPPPFVAHATHCSQDDYRKSSPHVFESVSLGTDIVPAFSKATQNELSAMKKFLSNLTKEERLNLQDKMPKAAARVFAIATKTNNKGKSILDQEGKPIPQDGSYAYALKKCSASINYVDGAPLLVGIDEKYKNFENGENVGHIYIGEGTDFIPEYDNNGNITELTSSQNLKALYHYEISPKEAMSHNVQLVMFAKNEYYEAWSNKVRQEELNKGEKFETFTSSDSIRMQSLKKEIAEGRATYINASPRGKNPLIKTFEQAEIIKRGILMNRISNKQLD